VRIVTWNIRAGGGQRVDRIAKRLARWRPDLVVLCEFRGTPPSRQLAARLAARGLAHQKTSVAEDQPTQNALLIASRWPLQSRATRDAPKDLRRWLPVRVLAPAPFDLGAMHIPNRVSGRKDDFYTGVTNVAARWRRRPAILIGDTNTGWPQLDEEVPCFGPREENFLDGMTGLGWADAFRHLRGSARAYTWYSPNGGNGFRLDQAFVSSLLSPRLLRASYLWGSRRRGALSDHAALIVDLAELAPAAS